MNSRVCRNCAPGAPRRAAWVAKVASRSASRPALAAQAIGHPVPCVDPIRDPARAQALNQLDILACDYRIPMARLRDEGSEGIRDYGCGCQAVCLAGRSSKGDGLVGHECRSCPLAGKVVG